MFCPQHIHCVVEKNFSTLCKPSPTKFKNWTAFVNDHLPIDANHHIYAQFSGVFIRLNGPMNCQYRFANGALSLSPPSKMHFVPSKNNSHWKRNGMNYFCEKQYKTTACQFVET